MRVFLCVCVCVLDNVRLITDIFDEFKSSFEFVSCEIRHDSEKKYRQAS